MKGERRRGDYRRERRGENVEGRERRGKEIKGAERKGGNMK